MMKKANDDLLFLDEDNQLGEVTELKWLPWIGKEYFNTEHRLLIVGESHYLTGKEKNLLETEQPDFTRNVVQTFCINNKKPQPTFDNLARCMFGNQKMTVDERAEKWKHLAFYNFVQRPMENNKKRPTKSNLQKGWNVFSELIRILKPTHCIFIGFAAADCNNPYKCKRGEKVGRYAARLFEVELEENDTCRCVAIKHTSQYFSWEKWRKLLKTQDFLF